MASRRRARCRGGRCRPQPIGGRRTSTVPAAHHPDRTDQGAAIDDLDRLTGSSTGTANRRVQLSRSHASYSPGGRARAPTAPDGLRPAARDVVDRANRDQRARRRPRSRSGAGSARTAHTTVTSASVAPAAALATPKAGHVGHERRADRRVSTWVGPSPPGAPAPTTTSWPGACGSTRPPPPRRESAERLPHQLLQTTTDPGVLGLGVRVDPGDRRAREDVMELVEEHGPSRARRAPPPPRAGQPSIVHHSSASSRSRSQRRLPTFVRTWLVSVPRCISK